MHSGVQWRECHSHEMITLTTPLTSYSVGNTWGTWFFSTHFSNRDASVFMELLKHVHSCPTQQLILAS